MSLQSNLAQLENLVINIETRTLKMKSHFENANTASIAAAATYLLTSNAKNNTVRTLGQIGAIGGFLYSGNQRKKANNIEELVIQNVTSGISMIESGFMLHLKSERDQFVIRKFLELVLRMGRSFDPIIERNISKVGYIGLLGGRNQQNLLSLNQYEVFNIKLKYNKIIHNIDREINLNHVENNYLLAVKQIDKVKLIREGSYMRAIILTLGIVGIILSQKWESAIYITFVGVALWILNHFFPFGTESSKLKKAVKGFCTDLGGTLSIRQITLR
jgi:hypothetical protein